MGGGDIRIRWSLDVVDRGAGAKLLRQDRTIRRSLQETDRQYQKTAAASSSAAARQAQASSRVARGLQGEGRAASSSSADMRRYNAAQREALAVGQRLVTQSGRVEQAYRRQGSAAEQASRRERAASRTRSAATGIGRGASGAAGLAGGIASRGLGLAAAGGVGFGLVAAARDASGFESAMANVQARLDLTRKAMAPLNKLALELGAKTQYSAGQAADAMGELAAAGYNTQKILKVLPGTLSLAAASGQDLASSASLQVTTLNAFRMGADKAGHVADALAKTVNVSAIDMGDLSDTMRYIAPVAHATGQSFEDMMASVALLGNVGIKGEQAGTTLRQGLIRLIKPTKMVQEAFGDLGIKASELYDKKGLRPLPRVIATLSKHMDGMTEQQKKQKLAMIFGTNAISGMLTLVDRGAPSIDRMSKSIYHSEGYAKHAAGIMRHTVAGAWDNFKGSVETASIALTRRFMPAVRNALNAGASGVNAAAAAVGRVGPQVVAGIATGLHGKDAQGRLIRTGGGAGGVERTDPSKAATIGAKIGQVARTVGQAAATAGRQLLEAFKPALPFFQNVLLPLLIGVGKGVLGSVVAAFKVLIPIIRITATVLGAIGKAAKPFRGAIEGIGTVIGFVVAGPILKLLSGLGKIGLVFRVLGAPIRLISKLVGGAIGVFGRFGGVAGRAFSGLLTITRPVAEAVVRVAGLLGGLPRRVGAVGVRIVGAAAGIGVKFLRVWTLPWRTAARLVITTLAPLAGRLLSLGGHLISSIASGVRGRLGDIVGFFGRLGKSIIRAIVNAITAAPGAIIDAIKGLVPGSLRKVASKIPGNPLGFRRGGRVRAYRDGGLVDAMVSPGEALVYGSHVAMVPGAPTAADTVLARVPPGTAVLTTDGQSRVAGGASLGAALASQAPHFRTGGVVPGTYSSTAYGPPWGGIQGSGRTRTGVNLRNNPHLYGVAVDPSMIPLGASVYAQPNPFGRTGPFRAFDTGGAIKGRRVDFYDWRGRGAQNRWGRRDVKISASHLPGSTTTTGGGDATAHVPIMLGRSRTRAGLVDDALAQGIDAGTSGLTRREIALAAAGARGARVNPIIEAIRGAQSATRRDVKVPGSSGGGSLPSGVYVPSGTFNPQRKPIARWIVPYLTYGASHGWSGIVTSGYRDPRVRVVPGRGLPVAPQGQSNHNRTSYPGGAVDVTQAASLAAALRKRPGAHLLKWAGAKDPVHFSHPSGGHYRTGGIVGRARRGAALPSLDVAIGAATDARLELLRRTVVAQVRAGGDKRVVQRLQGLIDLIDFEVGRRIGALSDAITRRGARLERAQGAVDRGMRRAGIDTDSAGGLARQGFFTALEEVPARQRNVRDAREALRRAKRTGNRDAIRAAAEQLATAQDDLDEAITKRIETSRQLIVTVATDTAAKVGSLVERGRAQLDRALRVSAIDPQSAAGLTATVSADAVEVGLRKGVVDTLEQTLRTTSDPSAIRQLSDLLDTARDDLADAFVKWVEDGRAAIAAAAQERVDTAQFGLSVAQGNAAMLDVGQRAGGTADTSTGMLERAATIQQTLLPALEANRNALAQQAADLAAIGDTKGAQQAFLAAQQASTDLASAMVDAADLIRQAAQRAAQDRVDLAQFRVDIAQANAGLFEASQRGINPNVVGTADTATGMRERAALEQSTVIPALKARADALSRFAAGRFGNTQDQLTAITAARQATLDLAQAQVDAADLIRAAAQREAQDRVDTSQFALDVQGAASNALDVAQRLQNRADTAGAMRERADAIQGGMLPLLAAHRDALLAQYNTLNQMGDLSGARQAWLGAQQAANDLGAAMADAADLVRQAAQQEAQDRVDIAGHATTMADLARQRVELEQRIAGTFDTGTAARADFIQAQIIPAIEGEIAALAAQQLVAQQQGNRALADQIAEALAGKQNDKLQAIIDATEQTATNTEPRKVGGTLGFAYGQETLTDALIGVGNGS